MYTEKNFKTKKALKEAVAAGEKIFVYQPNDMFGSGAKAIMESFDAPQRITIEGPHYPEPHRWYASATLDKGVVTKVK